MTNREHFMRFMRYVRPNLPLTWNEQEQCFLDDTVSLAWQAWQEARLVCPTEHGRITKEQIAAAIADPETIVDRLRGIYPNIETPYPTNPLQRAAADEIERLRTVIREMEGES
jgi:hypothetical protein